MLLYHFQDTEVQDDDVDYVLPELLLLLIAVTGSQQRPPPGGSGYP